MGLVQRYPGERLNNQAARQISFAFSDSTLEKVLVYGVNGGRDIVNLLGLGFVPTNSTYRLLVFEASQTKHARGFWENLEPFMRAIYGQQTLPSLTSAIAEISSKSFAELTSCNTDQLQVNPGNFAAANCSAAYQNASLNLFPFNAPCNATAMTFEGGFTTTCIQEQNLLSRRSPPPSAVELRAFLYNCDGFNSLFTGYGYTAEVYGGPLAREYWVENVREEELVGSEAPEFYVS